MPWHFLLNKSVHGDTKAIQAYCNHKIALSSSTNTSVTHNGWRNLPVKRLLTVVVSQEVRFVCRGQVSCLSIKSFLSETDSGLWGERPLFLGDSVNVVYISCCHGFHYDSYRKDRSGTWLYKDVRGPLTFNASSLLYHFFWTIRNHKTSCLAG